jgi:hypothetical protein
MAMDNSGARGNRRGKRTAAANLLFLKDPFLEQKKRTIHVLQNRTFLFALDTKNFGNEKLWKNFEFK